MNSPSYLPPFRKPLLVIIAIVSFIWLLTPRLYGNFTNHLHKEDGFIFLTDALHGKSLLETYTGYLHVYPRAISSIGIMFPPEYFSLVVAISVALIRVALFFLLLMTFAPFAKNKEWALGAALIVIFCGSGQQEVLGNITNLRWFLDIGATVALLGVFRTWGGITLALFFLYGGTLSDPLSLALLPVAIWRFLALSGRARIVPALYFPAFLLHSFTINTGARESALLHFLKMPINFFEIVTVRGITIPFLGETSAQAGILLAGTLITVILTVLYFMVLLWMCFKNSPLKSNIFASLLICAGLAFLVATMNFTTFEVIRVDNGISNLSRYSLIPSVLVPSAFLLLLSWVPRAGWSKFVTYVFCGLLGFGALVDSRGDEWSTHGPEWSSTIEYASEQCEARSSNDSDEITVDVTPQGVPLRWTANLKCSWVTR